MPRMLVLVLLSLVPLLLIPEKAEAGRVIHLISEIINSGSIETVIPNADDFLRWVFSLLGLA